MLPSHFEISESNQSDTFASPVENGLITVIVPVYKVEFYLRRCLDSIIHQTYRHLEIILIDDGSPDNCGAICDEYAAMDSRIRVIHQTNRGVSAARNAGLDVATGDYIAFVDPDDYLAHNMYERMGSAIQKDAADIVFCGYNEVWKHQTLENRCLKDVSDTIQEYRDKMWGEVATCNVWNKLYKRSLFDHLRFPVGRSYEDFVLMPQLYDKAEKITGIQDCLYFYICVRDGSVMNTMKKDFSHEYAHFITYLERIENNNFDGNPYFQTILRNAFNNACTLLRKNALHPSLTDEQLDTIIGFIEKHLHASKYRSKYARELFMYRHGKWFYKKYSRYRLEKYAQKEQAR